VFWLPFSYTHYLTTINLQTINLFNNYCLLAVVDGIVSALVLPKVALLLAHALRQVRVFHSLDQLEILEIM
jgi:hypothetical protein